MGSDAGPGGPEEDEVLDVGRLPEHAARRRLSMRVTRVLTAVAALAVVVAGAVTLAGQSGTHARPAPPPSASVPSVQSSAEISRAAALPGPIETIRALVARPGQLGNLVRQDTPAGLCATVAVGHSPSAAVIRAASRDLGPTRLIDVQRTIDQFTGLCAMDVRARMAGVVVTISITSAGPHVREAAYDFIETGVETLGDVTTEYALARTRQGWTVLVGATGAQDRLPGSRQLLQLAQEPSLTW